ncbi:PREDICTED: Na(+)/H(+) exchange regulatory cofactor NHE-RF1, partial [Myotis davidii]
IECQKGRDLSYSVPTSHLQNRKLRLGEEPCCPGSPRHFAATRGLHAVLGAPASVLPGAVGSPQICLLSDLPDGSWRRAQAGRVAPGHWNDTDCALSPQRELRPRLCAMKRGPNGYGFNLHSDKTKPGQFIRSVDPDSPAEASGLQAQDRIVEVNGVCMEGKQHGDVVSAIKAGGEETKLLVVDKETDEFFKKCKVIPSHEHLHGPLPEPFTNGEIQKENSYETLAEVASENPRPALARSTSSDTSEELNSQDGPKKQDSAAPSSTSSSDPIPDFNISLAVAKERAHQKRSNKRAPQMDWSKKNELFSNL